MLGEVTGLCVSEEVMEFILLSNELGLELLDLIILLFEAYIRKLLRILNKIYMFTLKHKLHVFDVLNLKDAGLLLTHVELFDHILILISIHAVQNFLSLYIVHEAF